jgi:hypothetical protein
MWCAIQDRQHSMIVGGEHDKLLIEYLPRAHQNRGCRFTDLSHHNDLIKSRNRSIEPRSALSILPPTLSARLARILVTLRLHQLEYPLEWL